MMRDFKLANLLFEVEDFLTEHADLLYRVDGAVQYDAEDGTLAVAGAVDFLTYFNALPLVKWREYCGVDNVWLHVEVAGGACQLALARAWADEPGPAAKARVTCEAAQDVPASDTFAAFDIPIALDDAALVGLQVDAPDAAVLRNAYFYTQVDEERIRPIELALSTTTYNNERYILPNIALIEHTVLGCDDPIAQHFHLFVVDNGRSLDAAALSNDGVTVVPNPNVGGAGGFARGMMCALDSEQAFTHVLLMDDDVHVSPESFKRCFNLLSLARDEYAEAFVNGAMLQLQNPSIQFEDVSFVRDSGGYQRYKPTLDVSELDALVANETTAVNGKTSYGAWWFCCIPVSQIRAHGLPLPLFVRIDDVEYGMRCHPTYMTMGGVCVWHSAFGERYRASVDAYQYLRNMLICIAVHGCSNERTFMMRYRRSFEMFLRVMNYEAAGLWLDALEDYLKGPDFIMNVDGAALLKVNGSHNEKLVPIEQIDSALVEQLDIRSEWLGGRKPEAGTVAKVLQSLPHDRHWFPDFLLSSKPAMVDMGGNSSPWTQVAMKRTLVALDGEGENGHVRTIDRERYKRLWRRYRTLMADYRKRGAAVAQAYRDAMPTMTSEEFWKDYLAKRA